MPDLPEQTSCYEQWHSKVWDAYSRYMEASARYRAILEEQLRRPIPNPDWVCALTKARQEESATYCEYMQELRILTELVTQRKLPPEEQPPE